MEASDKTPEERVGTAYRIRRRARELRELADACDAEASDADASARRLRVRAPRLRELAEEYDVAAAAADRAHALGADMADTSDLAVRAPVTTVGAPPTDPQGGDVWMEQDPVSLSTYRRMEYHPGVGWRRMGPVDTR